MCNKIKEKTSLFQGVEEENVILGRQTKVASVDLFLSNTFLRLLFTFLSNVYRLTHPHMQCYRKTLFLFVCNFFLFHSGQSNPIQVSFCLLSSDITSLPLNSRDSYRLSNILSVISQLKDPFCISTYYTFNCITDLSKCNIPILSFTRFIYLRISLILLLSKSLTICNTSRHQQRIFISVWVL